MTWFKSRCQHVMLIFLFVYTLCYLLLMNGIYTTNLTHRTSINIQVRANEQAHVIYETIAGNGYQRNKQYNTDVAKTGDNPVEDQSEVSWREKIRNKLYFYDHTVLHRIHGRYVFYLSAITHTGLRTTNYNNASALIETNTDDISTNDKDGVPDSDYVGVFDGIYYNTDEVFKSRNIETLWEAEEDGESYHSNRGVIVLNGWENYVHRKSRYECCYKYSNNGHQSANLIKKITWNVNDLKIVKATQFVCPLLIHTNNYTSTAAIIPTHVALAPLHNCRNRNYSPKYVEMEPTFPKLDHESIGICAKLIYRNFSADKLIEWVEFNVLMGVDRIMLFTYTISPDVKHVLDFYVNQGVIFIKEFDYPSKKTVPRLPGGKNVMSFQDEQVTVFDCMERFNRYDFVAVLDLDEFLVPAINSDWREMLSDLLSENPHASGFTFHTQIFTLDWGISNHKGEFFVTKYVKRTKTMWDRKKNIIIPSRVLPGSTWTHEFTSLNGYQPIKVQSDKANIFHYRKCRPHWIMFGTCKKKRKKFHDVTMVNVMDRIKTHIIQRKQQLLT